LSVGATALRATHRFAWAACAAVLAATAAAQAQAPSAPRIAEQAEGRLLTLDVVVNGARGGAWPLLEQGGVLYAPREAFEDWRIALPADTRLLVFRGQRYHALNALPGFEFRIDAASQSMELRFAPQVFSATRLGASEAPSYRRSEPLPALVLNYDLNFSAADAAAGASTRDLGLLAEAVWSGAWGVLVHSAIGRNLGGETGTAQPRRGVRLDTAWVIDQADERRTLRLGDAITRPGLLGRGVYFGGVQYGSNHSFVPGFTGKALPVVRGVSSAPSTVELYVNDVLRHVSNVPAGPFSIDNVPLINTAGEARVVVRDVLGRETVLLQPFFTHALLLAEGHAEWSAELGRERLDYGSASGRYGRAFATGVLRRGLNPQATVEGRAEVTRTLANLALGLTHALPWQSLATVAMALSDERESGRGHQWLLGLEQQGLRSSAQLQAQGASRAYRQLGQEPGRPEPRTTLGANLVYALRDGLSLNAGVVRQRFWDTTPRTSSASLNLTAALGRSTLGLHANRAFAGSRASAFGVVLMMPLAPQVSASAQASRRGGRNETNAAVSGLPSSDRGLGWRVLAGHQLGAERAEGGVVWLGERTRLAADVHRVGGQNALRLGASGALVAADGRLFASRRIDDSFAVVEVPGQPDLGIDLRGRRAGTTDGAGVVLVNSLLPHQFNLLRLNAAELPLSAELPSIEANAVPAWRSAVKITFPVRAGRAALLRIVLDDGDAAPAGATITIAGRSEPFHVARRGEAFLTGLEDGDRVRLSWNGRHCELAVDLPPAPRDDITRVGPLRCAGVPR
jgi:outer membrane usher protein